MSIRFLSIPCVHFPEFEPIHEPSWPKEDNSHISSNANDSVLIERMHLAEARQEHFVGETVQWNSAANFES